MACYDQDNASLMYPIKITTEALEYDTVSASKSDPHQGWAENENDCNEK